MNTMQNQLSPEAHTHASLSARLEAINQGVKASDASPAIISATLKLGLAYAIFLTELEEGTSALSQDQVKHMLERTEKHCAIYENEFPDLMKGIAANE